MNLRFTGHGLPGIRLSAGLLFALVCAARAQTFSIDWFTLSRADALKEPHLRVRPLTLHGFVRDT